MTLAVKAYGFSSTGPPPIGPPQQGPQGPQQQRPPPGMVGQYDYPVSMSLFSISHNFCYMLTIVVMLPRTVNMF